MDGKELAASMMRLVAEGAAFRFDSFEEGILQVVIITATGSTVVALGEDFTDSIERVILDLAIRRLSDPAEFV